MQKCILNYLHWVCTTPQSWVFFNPSWSGLFLGLTFLARCWGHQPTFGLPNFSQVGAHCFSSGQQRLHLGRSPRVSPRETLPGHAQHTQTSSSEERRWSRQFRPPLFWPGLSFPLVGQHIWDWGLPVGWIQMEHWENPTVSKRTVSFLNASTILIKKLHDYVPQHKDVKSSSSDKKCWWWWCIWMKSLHLRFYSLRNCQGVSCLHVHQHLRRKNCPHFNFISILIGIHNQLGIC